ncbi:MAG: hypothetical protein J5746_13210 [Victivallales bacterium]|nr:hypothetical protein [Victivallales bacterium]
MTSYYIMQDGQLMGPADEAKIKSMVSRGLIPTDATISQDRLNWFPVKSLLENEVHSDAEFNMEASQHSAPPKKSLMLVVWALVLALALFFSASAVILVYTGSLHRWFSFEQVKQQEDEDDKDESDSEADAEENKEDGKVEQQEQ